MALILSLSAVPRRCPQWIQAVSRGQSWAGRIGRDSIRRLGKRFERSPPGACLGHGLADNHRHERSVPDTRDSLFTWENTRCQPLPSDWFFPDTEDVIRAAMSAATAWSYGRYRRRPGGVGGRAAQAPLSSVRAGSVPQRSSMGSSGRQRSPTVGRNRRSSAVPLTQLGRCERAIRIVVPKVQKERSISGCASEHR
jgi:hypothetical protein